MIDKKMAMPYFSNQLNLGMEALMEQKVLVLTDYAYNINREVGNSVEALARDGYRVVNAQSTSATMAGAASMTTTTLLFERA